MKICLLGEYSGSLDEGMKKVSSYFAHELSKRHQILTIDLKNINVFDKNFWKTIKNFNPEIVHYIHGPSIKSLMLMKIISIFCKSKTIMSAMHPRFTIFSEQLIPFFKPDLILIQSSDTEKMFNGLGCRTEFVPCGVELDKFRPVSIERKIELRQKYDVDKQKFVILHVGSIKEGRNIRLFEKLQKNNDQIIIVGAISPGIDNNLVRQLEKAGCMIWTKYFDNIEEIYAMADCYVFPVIDRRDILRRRMADSIEMPLSVLEAMSCNLSVITTRFGVLPRIFNDDSLLLVEDDDGFAVAIEHIKNINIVARSREKVLQYSWENVGKKLEKSYLNIIKK